MLRWLPLVVLASACATVDPRFEQDVATTFAHDEMRHLVTPEVEVYYPAKHRQAAEQVAARAAECLRTYRGHEVTRRDHDRALLFVTSSNYNNAYVTGMYNGEPLHALLPLVVTEETFHWDALPGTEAGDIACHEMFHFAHFEQVEGFWRAVNAVLGPVVPAQGVIERWFTEGVAQYYEGRIRKTVGRPHSPLYRGAFESFVAARDGRINAGDLNVFQRELNPFSGAYLVSLPFVEWLAAKYGEEKLWQVMEKQGRDFFFPLGVTLRFRDVYGASIGALVDQWSDELHTTLKRRERPPTQRVLRPQLGQLARLASHPASGQLALLTTGNDEGPRLRILSADGTVKVETTLVRLTPDREYIIASPGAMSGLSFSGDGHFLYLLNDDLIDRGDTRGQLWKIDAATGEVVKVWQDVGYSMGGAVRPDGTRYTMVTFAPGRADLVDYDLGTGEHTLLQSFPGRTVSSPAWSPDGSRLVYSRYDANGWNLAVRDADGATRDLTTDGQFNYTARWADDTHVVFSRAEAGRLQVHRLDVDSGRLEVLTDAPWTLVDPSPLDGAVAFVNRDGTQWSLDVAPATALAVLREAAPERPPSEEVRALDAAQQATLAEPEAAASAKPEPPASAPVPSTPLVVESDEPYSPLDHLFVPQLRTPQLNGSTSRNSSGGLDFTGTVGLALAGKDRLGHHAWSLAGTYTFPNILETISTRSPVDGLSVVALQYRNMQLAPWSIAASASRIGFSDQAYWNAGVEVSRTIFTTPVSIGFEGNLWQPFGEATQRFIGPTFGVAYFAGESTAYGGTQRALSLALSARGYPRAFGSSRDMLDVAAEAGVTVPLPFLTRHSLDLDLLGRALPGGPEDGLRIGGVQRGTPIWVSNAGRLPRSPDVYLPDGLIQGVRGYEDTGLRANAAAIGSARYRYRFIVDKGFASTLWLFPSLFLRQVDLDVFGSAAVTDKGQWMRAVGASLAVRLIGGSALGLTLYYQFSYRFDLGAPTLHSVGLAFE